MGRRERREKRGRGRGREKERDERNKFVSVVRCCCGGTEMRYVRGGKTCYETNAKTLYQHSNSYRQRLSQLSAYSCQIDSEQRDRTRGSLGRSCNNGNVWTMLFECPFNGTLRGLWRGSNNVLPQPQFSWHSPIDGTAGHSSNVNSMSWHLNSRCKPPNHQHLYTAPGPACL